MPVTGSRGLALLLATGLLGMSRLGSSANLPALMWWLVLARHGYRVAAHRITTIAPAGAADDAFGMAAGILDTFQATGLALGISVMGLIFTTFGQ